MVQSTIFVREVIPTDIQYAEQASNVVNAAYRSEGGWTTEKHLVGGLRSTPEAMTQLIENNGKPNTLLFAFEENNVVGTVMVQPDPEHTDEFEIGTFSVSPLHQSRGIGGMLIRSAIARAKELGFSYATLHLLEGRPEILAWYKKLGFEETGERIPFIWPELLKDKALQFIVLKKSIV